MLLVPIFGSSFITFAISNNIISINLSKRYEYGKFSFLLRLIHQIIQQQLLRNESFGQKINFASLLSSIPKLYIQQGYDFINGIKEDRHFGFQLSITSAPPVDKYYSPLTWLNL
jgi:hypothetical protein